MSEWRRAVSLGKRDDAEAGVVEAFEEGGASVARISGKDIGDLVVGYLGIDHWIEVKTNKAKLRDGQKRWADTWKGERPSIARTPAQARKLLRQWLERATSLSTLLRANAAAVATMSHGGGIDAAPEDHEDLTAERARTEEP